MRNRLKLLFAAFVLTPFLLSAAEPADLLQGSGVKGGLVVRLGCGDGARTVALRANDRYIVQGLEADPAKVEQTRATIRAAKCYGIVSACHWSDTSKLPYADNTVNLLVVEEGAYKGTDDELLRVLAPLGVAVFLNHQSQITNRKLEKPWPKEIDEWTHFLHDAGNGSVARDTRVGPPKQMQWVVEPLWSRGHELPTSIGGAVTARGRIFYVLDEGQTGVYTLPARWTLLARDAFNGVPLWRRPLSGWGPDISLGGFNNDFRPRRLVTDGAYVYLPMGEEAMLTAIDAATGETVKAFNDAVGATDILCEGGLLLVTVDSSKGDGKEGRELLALETGSWKARWRVPTAGLLPQTLALSQGRIACREASDLLGLNATDGRQVWRTPLHEEETGKKVRRRGASVLVFHKETVLLFEKGLLSAFSAETGKPLWEKGNVGSAQEFFVIDDLIWRNRGDLMIAHDLATGEQRRTIDAGPVFSKGHHPRCYPYKATDRYIISNNRGAEFVGVQADELTQNDWLRGNCGLGVMPANGLLYAPPCQCFCYGGALATGFKAVAAGPVMEVPAASFTDPARLLRGPAYDEAQRMPAAPLREGDWPMYRRNPERCGSTKETFKPDVVPAWQADLGGRLTPPVMVGGLVLVAAKDAHTVHALKARDGKAVWQFTADARIDSPPTFHDGLVFFGSADGRAYGLRASDGQLVWRFQAAPRERWVGAFGQMESAWPVHGSVVVLNGVVYLSAGRSTYLDGGIHVYGLEPRSGRVLHHACLKDEALAPGAEERANEKKPFLPAFHTEGTRSDLLVSDGEYLFMGAVKLNTRLERQETPYIDPGDEKARVLELTGSPFVNPAFLNKELLKRHNTPDFPSLSVRRGPMGDKQMGLRLLATGGFLDDTWFNRTYWMYARIWPGFYIAQLSPKAGQLLSFDEKTTYGVQAFTTRTIHSPTLEPGTKGYLLFADDNNNEPVLDDRSRNRDKGLGFARAEPPKWHQWVPLRIRAMVATEGTLFIAGSPDLMPKDDPYAAIEGRKGAELWAVSTTDGKKLTALPLEFEPVFDGLIAADGRLYVSLRNGRVVCLAVRP